MRDRRVEVQNCNIELSDCSEGNETGIHVHFLKSLLYYVILLLKDSIYDD